MDKPAILIMLKTVASFLLFSNFISISLASSTATQISYSHHCASIVPEASVRELVSRDAIGFPHDGSISGFFTGGSGILKPTSSFSYHSQSLHATDVRGLFYLDGESTFENAGYDRSYYYEGSSSRRKVSYYQSQLRLSLTGFWLEATGTLCMVGLGSTYSQEGKELSLAVVLKLTNFKNSTSFVSLIKGTLESLSDSNNEIEHFETVSLLIFPQMNADHPTLVSNDLDVNTPLESKILPSLSLSSLSKNSVCDLLQFRYHQIHLKYTRSCLSGKNCSPFGWSSNNLPSSLSFRYLQCSKDQKRSLQLIEFHNSIRYSYDFDPNMTWIGEGKWDEDRNQFIVAACQLSGLKKESFSDVHVGDCSLRLSLQYPSTMSIKHSQQEVGQIWSTRSSGETDRNSDTVRLEGFREYFQQTSGLKYEYTQTDKVLKSCPDEKPAGNESRSFPDPSSSDMNMDASVQIAGKKAGWGYSYAFSVGDRISPSYGMSRTPAPKIKVSRYSKSQMSYTITIKPFDQMKMVGGLNLSEIVISAEGDYDSETGRLCMIGCRTTAPKNQILEDDSTDCEILVKFQFPEANSKNKKRYINGSIESTRKTSDPLFFERLELVAAVFDRMEAEESVSRMDIEVNLALISISLASVFVAFQIFHVKKHPEVLPFISISMLSVLTLGYMIPLVLNFESLFSPKTHPQDFLRTTVGLEQEITVRAVILIAFLLQIRLLQLSWSKKFQKENRKKIWKAEAMALITTIALHIVGTISTTLLMKSVRNGYEIRSRYQSNWTIAKCYSGLILDGFLLPQILINAIGNWRGDFLCSRFYVGTTIVNLLPHAYDLYRYRNYPSELESTYIYASPDVEFFSVAWDIVIPIGCVVFALIVFLQQKFGGRFMLPPKWRDSPAYDQIPRTVSEEVEA